MNKSPWTKVVHSLPKSSNPKQKYLVMTKDVLTKQTSGPHIVYYRTEGTKGYWATEDCFYKGYVVAWMEVPSYP